MRRPGLVMGGLVLGWLVLTLPPLRAEEAKTDKPQVLEEVTVTATRTEVPAKETGVATTVITAREMADRQATRVEEMLRTVPGAVVNQTGSRGGTTSLFVRGGENDQTQVRFNGIKLNNVGGSFDWSVLTVDNLERIEVVRGPMSALYGTDSLTGVVNLMTKKGKGAPSLSVTTTWGAHSEGHGRNNLIGEQRASLSGSYKIFSYSIAYSRLDDTGILSLNNRFGSNVLNSRLDLDPTEQVSFTFHTLLLDSYFGFPTVNSGDRFDPKSVGGPGLDPDQNNRRFDLVLGLTGRYQPTDWWDHKVVLSHAYFDRRYNNPANPLATDADLFGSFFSRNLERHYTLDYQTNFRFGDKKQVASVTTLGVELFGAQLKARTDGFSTWTGPFFTQGKYRQGSTSWYLQQQVAVWNRLFITAGGRLEDNRAFNKLEFAPRGSVALRLPETDTTLRAGGGRGIKAPTFLESHERTSFTVGNPNLKPEQNVGWEAGLDQYFWQDQVQMSLTYFHNHFKDFITLYNIGPFPRTFVNLGAVRTRGLELALRARPGYGLTLRAAYTHLFQLEVLDDGGLGRVNPFFRAGTHLLRRPRNVFSFDVDWKWKRLGLHLNGLYTGRRDDNYYDWATFAASRVVNGGFFVLNLAASYEVVRDWGYIKSVQLLARANNLFDRFYEESYGYSSPRFNIVAGVKAVF